MNKIPPKILGPLLILAGILPLLIYAVSLRHLIFPKADVTLQTCIATDASSLARCVTQVNSHLANEIKIPVIISCPNPSDCNINLSGLSSPVYVTGLDPTTSGFSRSSSHSTPIITIQGSQDIKISNLSFDEDSTIDCPYPDGGCSSPIKISSSTNIDLDNLVIKSPKVMAIEISQSTNVTIQNSSFFDAKVFGVWIDNDPSRLSSNIHITNNTFTNNRANAILFSGSATPDSPSTISGNAFIHNHRLAVFNTCNGPCSGGQLLIESGTNNLTINNNVIKEGLIEDFSGGWGASGIEFQTGNIHFINILNNEIFNNSGVGIIANNNLVNTDNISITQNHIYNNARGDVVFPGATISDNCLLETCSSPSPSPTPTPTPTATPTPTPTPEAILGDLNQNGRVDIFDYNLLIADFGKTNSPANLNGNGTVDIFDYNILVANFGK